MSRLLFIGDDPDQFQSFYERVTDSTSPGWQETPPVLVTGGGATLMSTARRSVEQYFLAGDDCLGGIVLDLNWGTGFGMSGCEFVHWLRYAEYRQPVLLTSDYVQADGTLSPMIAVQLPPTLGWCVLTDDILDHGLPGCLPEDQALRARFVAIDLGHKRDVFAAMSQIRQEVAGEFYGKTVNWDEVARWADLLSLSAHAETQDVWGSSHNKLVKAIGQRDAAFVIEAVYSLEALKASQ